MGRIVILVTVKFLKHQITNKTMDKLPIKFSTEVKYALDKGLPIVALESTIISHGLPRPQNFETACKLEEIVSSQNVVPATIAIIDGVINIGLSRQQLELFSNNDAVNKVSCADIAYTVSHKFTGSTTVAATMAIASHVGIEVFATGGIGGVHKEAEKDFDISADLYEFAKSKVLVVASGAKAILDIPKTLEVLESQSVPVLCYQSDYFPAFWSASSGILAQLRTNTVLDIVSTWKIQNIIFPSCGMLIANPVSKNTEIKNHEIDMYISKAVNMAKKTSIKGKEVTPFILKKLAEFTMGKSLICNQSLIYGNALLAAKIAKYNN